MDIPNSGLSTKSEFVSTLNSSLHDVSPNNMPALYPNSVALNASMIAQRKASLPLYDPESLGVPASSRSKSIHTNNDTYSVTDREEEKEDERNSMITKLRKTIPSSTSPPASTFTKYADTPDFAYQAQDTNSSFNCFKACWPLLLSRMTISKGKKSHLMLTKNEKKGMSIFSQYVCTLQDLGFDHQDLSLPFRRSIQKVQFQADRPTDTKNNYGALDIGKGVRRKVVNKDANEDTYPQYLNEFRDKEESERTERVDDREQGREGVYGIHVAAEDNELWEEELRYYLGLPLISIIKELSQWKIRCQHLETNMMQLLTAQQQQQNFHTAPLSQLQSYATPINPSLQPQLQPQYAQNYLQQPHPHAQYRAVVNPPISLLHSQAQNLQYLPNSPTQYIHHPPLQPFYGQGGQGVMQSSTLQNPQSPYIQQLIRERETENDPEQHSQRDVSPGHPQAFPYTASLPYGVYYYPQTHAVPIAAAHPHQYSHPLPIPSAGLPSHPSLERAAVRGVPPSVASPPKDSLASRDRRKSDTERRQNSSPTI